MPKVLIIDDHANVRLVYREAFENAGYTVVEAGDGRQGVDAYHSDKPDLVITDIEMPELDGHSVISTIREFDADAKIIAVTGAGLHHLPVAHELGADQIFEKPLRPRDLIKAASDLMS